MITLNFSALDRDAVPCKAGQDARLSRVARCVACRSVRIHLARHLTKILILSCFGICLSSRVFALDVNGISLGISSKQVSETLGPAFKCRSVDRAIEATDDLTDKICWTGLDVQFFNHSVRIFYRFHEEKLWKAELIGLMPDAFDDVESSMHAKYGIPKIEEVPWTETFGGKMVNRVATWESGDVIKYFKYKGNDIHISNLYFYSKAGWQLLTYKKNQPKD